MDKAETLLLPKKFLLSSHGEYGTRATEKYVAQLDGSKEDNENHHGNEPGDGG